METPNALATFRKVCSVGFLFFPASILIIVLFATSANRAKRSCDSPLAFLNFLKFFAIFDISDTLVVELKY